MRKHISLSNFPSQENQGNKNIIFRGIWLCWGNLTLSEKVICLGIIFVPLWWFIGWSFMLLLWVAGIVVYDIQYYRKIRIKQPSLSVITLLLFAAYRVMIYVFNSPEIAPRAILDPFLSWGSGGLLLWYIQTHKICVRLQVAAWAFSILICTMMIWWLFFHFVVNEPFFIPPRTLFATILDKGSQYEPEKMGSVGNFLVPYYFGERGIGGFYRYTFFFPHPTITSFSIGFGGLVILDTKKPLWSFPLFIICVFLIFICQARNAWISLSIVLVIRWLLISCKTRGITFLLTLFAITSFLTLSLPAVTDRLIEIYTNTIEVTSNLRKDSSDVRSNIYQRTWESFLEEPLLGHGINGSPVLPGYEFALIGTESFILGTLLYKSGLLGSGLFITFFISFLSWLYKSRWYRPLNCFLMLLYLSLSSLVTEFQVPEIFIMLLCAIIHTSNKNRLPNTSD